jgi:AraC family transcriptional regulator
MTLQGGAYAMARFTLDPTQYGDAWAAVYGGWLPESGYVPDDRPAFELCHSGPEDRDDGKMVVDICVPVKPA